MIRDMVTVTARGRHLPVVIFAAMVLPLWEMAPVAVWGTGFVAYLVMSVLFELERRRLHPKEASDDEAIQIGRRFAVMGAATGACWGVTGAVLVIDAPFQAFVYVGAIILTISISNALSRAAYQPIVYASILPTVLPLLAYAAWRGTDETLGLAAIGFVSLWMMFAWSNQRFHSEAARVLAGMEATRLAADLAVQVAEAEEARVAADRAGRRFHEMFVGADVPMLMIDPAEERIVDANPAARRFYGEPPVLLGRRIADLADSDTDVEAETLTRLTSAAASDDDGQVPGANVMRHRTAKGEIRFVDLRETTLHTLEPPVRFIVVHDVTARIKTERALWRSAFVDEMTGALTRARFFRRGQRELERARIDRKPLCVILFDLDYFKKVNDTHGHAAGDAALRTAASAALQIKGAEHPFGRLGGEEFAILAIDTSLTRTAEMAERLRTRLKQLKIDGPNGPFSLTLSAGVAAFDPRTHADMDRLLAEADVCLYEAKNNGRDRVVAAHLASDILEHQEESITKRGPEPGPLNVRSIRRD